MIEIEKELSEYCVEFGTTIEEVLTLVGIAEIEYRQAIMESDSNFVSDVIMKHAQKSFDEECLIPSLKEFYNLRGLQLDKIIEDGIHNKEDNSLRLILNTIKRFYELSENMDNLKSGKCTYKIFHNIVCIEAIYIHSNTMINGKYKIFMDFMNSYVSEDGKMVLGEALRRNNQSIGFEGFCLLMNELRNLFVHEGRYWDFSFTNGETRCVGFKFPENEIERRNKTYSNRVYHMKLEYEIFINIMFEAYNNYIISFYNRT